MMTMQNGLVNGEYRYGWLKVKYHNIRCCGSFHEFKILFQHGRKILYGISLDAMVLIWEMVS